MDTWKWLILALRRWCMMLAKTIWFVIAYRLQNEFIKQDQDGERGDICQFCGTASYVSPEILHDKPATRAVDLWAMGCLIFQVLLMNK